MNRSGLTLAVCLAFLALSGCEAPNGSETEAAQSTAMAAANTDLQEIWGGKRWEGSWEGCTGAGAVEVLSMTGNRGKVLYEWGHCGNSAPGSFVDDNATFTPTKMKVSLLFGTAANYTLQDDGSLVGQWHSPRGGESTGVFTPTD